MLTKLRKFLLKIGIGKFTSISNEEDEPNFQEEKDDLFRTLGISSLLRLRKIRLETKIFLLKPGKLLLQSVKVFPKKLYFYIY